MRYHIRAIFFFIYREITGRTDDAITAFEQTCVMLCVISLNLSRHNRVLLVPLFYIIYVELR